jgi:GGDEF domain-containing protein
MSLPGPILVVSRRPDRKLAAALAAQGAFPIVDVTLDEAAKAISKVEPAAVVFADADVTPVQSVADKLMDAIDAAPAPFMPVVARVADCGATILDVLPIGADAPCEQLVARLGSAVRVRILHATVLRRIETLRGNGADVPDLPTHDPLEDATILVAGRGGSYPALSTAVGERLGLIGALSVETAARHLNHRDVDGIIVGEGFGAATVEAFLTALMSDARFRDLPVGIAAAIPDGIARGRFAGLEPVRGTPDDIVAHMMPAVRVHAFAARLRRHIAALDARGTIDPHTGLFTAAAFARDLPRAIRDAHERGIPMSIARIDFPGALGRRTRADVARLISRLIRTVDFACQGEDGSITVVFAESALRNAHVSARRIASVMRHTVLDGEQQDRDRVEATVTLAALKATDTPESLLARVSEEPTAVPIAAE